jgi:hypothetical protein
MDFEEYKNSTDPNKVDTDGDGKNDFVEIIEYEDSSPWGIDGVAPNITKIEKNYEKKFGGFTGLKLIGVDVKLTIHCRDDFGLDWINVKLSGEGERRVYFDGNRNVVETFIFRSDNYAKVLWSGFKINITSSDINKNIGFKESEVKGIIKAAFDSLVGALLPFAKLLIELISKMCDWLYQLPKKMLETIINTATELKNIITSQISILVKPMVDAFSNDERSKGGLGFSWVDFIDTMCNFPFFIAMGLLSITVFIIEKVVDGVSCGAQAIALSILFIILGILINMLLSTPEAKKGIGSAFGAIADLFMQPLSSLGVSNHWRDHIKKGLVDCFSNILSAFGLNIQLNVKYDIEFVRSTKGELYQVDWEDELESYSYDTESFKKQSKTNPKKNFLFWKSLGWSLISVVLTTIAIGVLDQVKSNSIETIPEMFVGFSLLVAGLILEFYASFLSWKPKASNYMKAVEIGASISGSIFTMTTLILQVIRLFGDEVLYFIEYISQMIGLPFRQGEMSL